MPSGVVFATTRLPAVVRKRCRTTDCPPLWWCWIKTFVLSPSAYSFPHGMKRGARVGVLRMCEAGGVEEGSGEATEAHFRFFGTRCGSLRCCVSRWATLRSGGCDACRMPSRRLLAQRRPVEEMGAYGMDSEELCTFASAFERKKAQQEKHCDCPYTEISPKQSQGGESKCSFVLSVCQQGVLTPTAYRLA